MALFAFPVVGTGAESDPFRPSVADAGVAHWACEMLSDATGAPVAGVCVVTVPDDDADAVSKLPGVTRAG